MGVRSNHFFIIDIIIDPKGVFKCNMKTIWDGVFEKNYFFAPKYHFFDPGGTPEPSRGQRGPKMAVLHLCQSSPAHFESHFHFHYPVLHYGFRWPIRFWNMGKVHSCFLLIFTPTTPQKEILTQEWPKYCVNIFWTHFHKKKMEKLRWKVRKGWRKPSRGWFFSHC